MNLKGPVRDTIEGLLEIPQIEGQWSSMSSSSIPQYNLALLLLNEYSLNHWLSKWGPENPEVQPGTKYVLFCGPNEPNITNGYKPTVHG